MSMIGLRLSVGSGLRLSADPGGYPRSSTLAATGDRSALGHGRIAVIYVIDDTGGRQIAGTVVVRSRHERIQRAIPRLRNPLILPIHLIRPLAAT